MSKILVTGASGFIGWHIARLLASLGHDVRALVRPASALRELCVELVRGDLRDKNSLMDAVRNCSVVYHVAADYRLWSRDPSELYQSNVEGTRSLLQAAENSGVRRFVYTSTVGCIGMPSGADGDEQSAVSIADMTGHYKRSKWMAEQIALEQARRGFPVVIVNPTAPVGDHDWKPTPTGKIIVDFLRNKLPAFVDTGLNLVDVQDVARGHLLAAERGQPGERYILGSENLSLQQILGKLAAITGRSAPERQVPYALAYAAGVASTAWAKITGKPPAVPLEAVKMARKKMFVSSAKATETLGFQPAPADDALRRAVHWFQENGYC